MMEKCWWCGKKLVRPGGKDVYIYEEVNDLDGNKLRVHKVCKQETERHFRPVNFGQQTLEEKILGE